MNSVVNGTLSNDLDKFPSPTGVIYYESFEDCYINKNTSNYDFRPQQGLSIMNCVIEF